MTLPSYRACTRCGWTWDGLDSTNRKADRTHCNVCQSELDRTAARMAGWETLHAIDYYDWTTKVVANDRTIEFVILDPRGRIRSFSEMGYGNAAVAMHDGLRTMFDHAEGIPDGGKP